MSNKKHPNINPNVTLKKKSIKTPDIYVERIIKKDRYILSEVITLLESESEDKRNLGLDVLKRLSDQKARPNSIRIGITGPPGVGKSTFIEALGLYSIEEGYSPAVLAIDPSSQRNYGSILGDKSRMPNLSSSEQAFIRPSPSGAHLGGTAMHSREVIELCELAGFDLIFIETVGVGQSEIDVRFLCDINILLFQPGSGDELQGIKRGIMESADIICVTKSDLDLLDTSQMTAKHISSITTLYKHEIKDWQVPVLLTSSVKNIGFENLHHTIKLFIKIVQDQNLWHKRRNQKLGQWMKIYFKNKMVQTILNALYLKNHITYQEDKSEEGETNFVSILLKIEDEIIQLRKKMERSLI